jgi:hypothetical protein
MFQEMCLIGVGFGLASTLFCVLLALTTRSGSSKGTVWVFLLGGAFCCVLVGVLLAIGYA